LDAAVRFALGCADLLTRAKQIEAVDRHKDKQMLTPEIVGPAPLPRAEEVRAALISLTADLRTKALRIGQLLFEAREQHHFVRWGYRRLDDFVESQLGLAARTGRDLAANYNHFVRFLRLSEQQLIPIGWSKLAVIRRVANEANVSRWLKLARDLSEQKLKDAVRGELGERPRDEPGEWGERELTYPKPVWELFDNALEAAKAEQGLYNDADALEAVLVDYLSGTTADGRTRWNVLPVQVEAGSGPTHNQENNHHERRK
jgi:hypothetical protein